MRKVFLKFIQIFNHLQFLKLFFYLLNQFFGVRLKFLSFCQSLQRQIFLFIIELKRILSVVLVFVKHEPVQYNNNVIILIKKINKKQNIILIKFESIKNIPQFQIKIRSFHLNTHLHAYNNSSTPSLWAFWHKWNYEHSLFKNILTFTNRILKGINKYHVFRWDWMVGFVGIFAGFVVTQCEELYYQVKVGYKPTTSKLVIEGVLKNQNVSKMLNDVLGENVFRSHNIQKMLKNVLIQKVLVVQKGNIVNLVKQNIKSINSQENSKEIVKKVAENVPVLKQPIKNAALSFLNSQTMDRITANALKSLLQSLMLKQLIADQINNYVKTALRTQQNSELLYGMIRQRFV